MKKIFVLLIVVAMMSAIAVPMSAKISPIPQPDVDIVLVPESVGKIEQKDNGDGTVTLAVNPAKGNNFVTWDLTGKYELVSGKLTEKTITIRPISDVKVQAVIKEGTTTTRPTVKPGASSPSTGVAPVMMAVAFVGSMAGAGICFKKSGKD